jgi:UDP-N-acetylmuramyl pentapeptide phosphotransferase/UDP-N-acetylglucosamine-1-phosphate transferase
MDFLTWMALGLIFFVIVLVVYMIVILHMVPGKIARKNKHPQVEAIEFCSLMGLIIFPFWMVALIWANFRPPNFMVPTKAAQADGTDTPPAPSTPSKQQKGKNA